MSDRAKKEAISNVRVNSSYPDDDWHEFIYEMWQEKLVAMGYEDAQISYSGFCSQGDGASFTCDEIDILKWLRSHKKLTKYAYIGKYAEDIWLKIERIDNHYCHYNTIAARMNSCQAPAIVDKTLDEFIEEINEDAKSLSRDIYKSLQEEYEALTSDDAIADMIEDNEYEFTADGKKA